MSGDVRLTERELQVLREYHLGLSDKEVAAKLGIATTTVRTHARAIYSKLDVGSKTRALHKGRTLNLI